MKFFNQRWLDRLIIGFLTVSLLALAVQLGRGKLWLVGATGVWLLFLITLSLLTLRWLLRFNLASLITRISIYGWLTALLTLVGLYLRIWGQHNGLPYIIPADENLVVDAGTLILKTGDFNPQMYYYPSFYIYLEMLVQAAHFLWGNLTGLYHNLADLPDRTYAITTAPAVYVWERTFSACFGTAAIPLAYNIVSDIYKDKRAGVISAGLIAFSALAVEHSHYIAVDMPMATLALAVLWFAWKIVESGRFAAYLWCGIMAGLTFSTKWNGVTILILPLVAHFLYLTKTTDKPLVIARQYISSPLIASLGASGVACLATTPYILASIKGYADAFAGNITKYRLSNAEYATDYAWLGNLQVVWQDSAALLLLSLAGIGLAFWRRDWLLLSFPLFYLLSMNSYRLIYPRNVLPLTLYFALFAGIFCSWLLNQLATITWIKPYVRFEPVLSGLAILAIMYDPLSSIIYGNNFNDQSFSYARVEAWLKKEAGPGQLKLVEMRPQQWGAYPNLLTRFGDTGAGDFNLRYYQERGIQYVAINHDQITAQKPGYYAELLQPANIAQKFETKTIEQPGPAYSIVRTGVTPTSLNLQHVYNADFSDKLKLLGVNAGKLDPTSSIYLPPVGVINKEWPRFKIGETIGLSVYWQVLAPLEQDYTVFLHLQPVAKPDVNIVSRDTQPLAALYPTSQWKSGEIVTDNPNLGLPASLPAGDYNLVMGLYLNDGKFTPLALGNGESSILLGKITVMP